MVGTKSVKHTKLGKEVGQALVAARKHFGLSIEDVEAELNVPSFQLRALEEGDFSVFAAEVYARGAYVKYASFLGIDTKKSHRAALRALSASRQTVPLKLHTPEKWWQRMFTPRFFIVTAGAIAVMMVGGYIIWQVRSFWQLPALALYAPGDFVVQDDSVTIRGASEKSVQIRVNGENLLLRDDNTFELTIDIHPGINILQVEAENAAGRKRVIERHLLHPRYDTL